jgi:hypothetical protein
MPLHSPAAISVVGGLLFLIVGPVPSCFVAAAFACSRSMSP